jgi:hypothetical protein
MYMRTGSVASEPGKGSVMKVAAAGFGCVGTCSDGARLDVRGFSKVRWDPAKTTFRRSAGGGVICDCSLY